MLKTRSHTGDADSRRTALTTAQIWTFRSVNRKQWVEQKRKSKREEAGLI